MGEVIRLLVTMRQLDDWLDQRKLIINLVLFEGVYCASLTNDGARCVLCRATGKAPSEAIQNVVALWERENVSEGRRV